MVDKKVVGALIAAASVGFGAGQLAKLPQDRAVVHAVDLRKVTRALPDGGTAEAYTRAAWAHHGEGADKKDLGPGKCAELTEVEGAHAAQVVADAEATCTW